MKDFLLGFLLASTIAFGTFTTYTLFCPSAKQSPTGIMMFMQPQDLMPPTPIKPKSKFNHDA